MGYSYEQYMRLVEINREERMNKLTVSKTYYGSNGTVDGNNPRLNFIFFEGFHKDMGGKEIVYCVGTGIRVGTLISFTGLGALHYALEKFDPKIYWVVEEGRCAQFLTNSLSVNEMGECRAVSAAEIVGKGDWILSGSQFWTI